MNKNFPDIPGHIVLAVSVEEKQGQETRFHVAYDQGADPDGAVFSGTILRLAYENPTLVEPLVNIAAYLASECIKPFNDILNEKD